MNTSRAPILRSILLLSLSALLSSCGASAEIEGEIDGSSLADAQTIMFGGPFIVIANEALDCTEMSWVSRHYDTQEPPVDQNVSLLQLSFSNDEQVFEGQFSVAGNAQVTSKFLKIGDGAFTELKGLGGMLIIDSVSEDSWVEGSLEGITFRDAEGELNGEFKAEWCRNFKNQ